MGSASCWGKAGGESLAAGQILKNGTARWATRGTTGKNLKGSRRPESRPGTRLKIVAWKKGSTKDRHPRNKNIALQRKKMGADAPHYSLWGKTQLQKRKARKGKGEPRQKPMGHRKKGGRQQRKRRTHPHLMQNDSLSRRTPPSWAKGRNK